VKRVYLDGEVWKRLMHLKVETGCRSLSEVVEMLLDAWEGGGVEAMCSATAATATGENGEQQPKQERPAELTERQLSHILGLLERNRWSWLDIKDVVEWELGVQQLPDDPADLDKATASRVIDLLHSWEKKPGKGELAEARKVLQQLPEDYVKQFNFPESVSQVQKYHITLARYALAKLQKQVKEEQKAATKS